MNKLHFKLLNSKKIGDYLLMIKIHTTNQKLITKNEYLSFKKTSEKRFSVIDWQIKIN